MQQTIRTALVADFSETSKFYGEVNQAGMSFIDRIEGPTVVVDVAEDATNVAIAEAVWHVGNRQARDAEGNAWPSNVRSFSMGDMVVIDGRVLVAVAVGFEQMRVSGPALGRVSARSEQGARGPWADASETVVVGFTDAENYDAWAAGTDPRPAETIVIESFDIHDTEDAIAEYEIAKAERAAEYRTFLDG